MSKNQKKVFPDFTDTRVVSPISMSMSVFESTPSIKSQKPINFKIHPKPIEQYKDVLKAIENWNLKEIVLLKNSKNFNEDNIFNYQFPNSLQVKLAPIFWNLLERCNFLHYACFYRATRTVKELLSISSGFNVNTPSLEGVTALHISCAIGDFYTIRELLSHGANRALLDRKGRLPMHYAVYTNIESCLVLTYDNAVDLNLEDENDISCLQYAKIANKPHIPDYMKGLEEKVKHYWIPQNIFQFECESISSRKENEEQCQCGQSIHDHISVLDKYDCDKNDFIEKPTNNFGEMEFSRLFRSSPYIRLSKNTSIEIIAKLLTEQWLIKKPSLIISICGSDFEGYKIKDILKKGIWKSAGNEGTHVWIITNGIDTSLIQVVGEAVRDFTDAYGEDQLYAIAFLPWSFNQKTDFLCSHNYQGNHPTEFQPNISKITHGYELDQNHSHYIFIDSPKIENSSSDCRKFRLEFENAVSNLEFFSNLKISAISSTADCVPLCSILVSGTQEDLKLLHGSMVRNGKPTVIIKGSGGLSNLIGFILDEISETNRKKKTLEQALEKEKLKNMMIEAWNVIDEFEEEIKMIKEIMENRDLIEIFFLDDDLPNELDKKILSCLLSQDKNSQKLHDQLNVSQMSIAISINRPDVAKEKIFTEGKKWKIDDLNPLVSKSITENKVGFVKLFIDKGFSIGRIITVDFLENLYTYDIFNGYKNARILNQGLRLIKFKRSSKKVTLHDIGGVIKYLLGDLYYPLYLRNSFQSTLNSKLPFERPIRELFIWTLLTQRMELSQVLWSLEKEAIASALFAANLLRSMINVTDAISDREDLSKWAEKFEYKAEGVVEECYKENPDNTRDNLIRELDYYGKSTYLELAADGNSIKFIAHRSCQELLDYVWRFSLDETTKSFEFIVYLIVGMIFPFILPFIVHYKPIFYLSEEEKANYKAIYKGNEKNLIVESHDHDTLETNMKNRHKKLFSKYHFKIYFRKIIDFYSTPVIKFSYTIFFYLIFILYFTFLNLTGLHVKNIYNGYLWMLIICTVSLSIEEVRQAFGSGISFKAYITDTWNRIDILSHSFFLVGTFCILMSTCDPLVKSSLFGLLDIQPMTAATVSLFRAAKFAYGFSIFLFIVRILQYFSINVQMGPIIVMIESMLANDLGPFMAILMVFLVSYGILLWSINFEVKANLVLTDIPSIFYEMLRTAYFQLYGDLRIDILRGENNLTSCTSNSLNCPDIWGVWLGPIIAAAYMVLSNVLMLNLLIAIFSNTYEIIQSKATQYWTLERYHLMRQSSNRPPVAPPFIIFWQIYYLISKLLSFNIDEVNPFKTSYINAPIKEKQLIQWEHMRAIDYMRSFDDISKLPRGNQTLVVNRGSGGAGSFGSVRKDLEIVRNEIIENFKERISFVENRLQRLDEIDLNVIVILDLLKQMEITDKDIKFSLLRADEHNIYSKEKQRRLNMLAQSDSMDDRSKDYSEKMLFTTKENSETSTKLWCTNIQNHILLRLVPISNTKLPLKMVISSEDVVVNESYWLNNDSSDRYGVPVNPHKQLGRVGKTLLPLWGVNSCIHIIISRWKRDEKGNILKQFGKPILQVIGISQNNKKIEIPFLFVEHSESCLVESCSNELLKGIIKDYISMLSRDKMERHTAEKDLTAFNTATINEIHRGYIDDFRNTDNSWIETVAFNVQQIYNLEFSNKFLEILEHHRSEKALWVDVLKTKWQNPGNITLLSNLAIYHDAGF